jgi:hypothetical protein
VNVAANVFHAAMLHGSMSGKFVAHVEVEFAFVGVKPRLPIDVVGNDRGDVFLNRRRDVE